MAGEKPKIYGMGGDEVVTVNVLALVAVPREVCTVTGPLVAPEGTRTVRLLVLFVVIVATGVPLNKIVVGVASSRESAVPLMVTEDPTCPLVGERLAMVGAGAVVIVIFPILTAIPAGVVMTMGPVTALAGNAVTVIDEEELKVRLALGMAAPPTTTVAPGAKPVPAMPIDCPA